MLSFLPRGSQIGAYRIERLLGRGGMSTVYLAEHTGLKRMVALKVLSPETAEDEGFRERFIRESELAASLDDPNVLPVYEAGEHDGVLFIAMRYVDGRDLRTVINEEGPLDPARVERIVDQVANALDAAHAKGLIHRDVKPANILLAPGVGSRAEHAYLADFGLSKRAASDSSLTGTGVFAGTFKYAAPEQFEGQPLDGRTDVYSMGCVLFECLTGQAPFQGDQDAVLMYSHILEPPPSATALRPELPWDVDRVVANAMAKRPNERYPTAGELASDLERALVSEPPTEITRSSRPRASVLLAIVGAVLVAGAMIAGFVLTRDDGASQGPPSSPVARGALPAKSLANVDPQTGVASVVIPDVPGLTTVHGAHSFGPNLAIGEGGVWLYALPQGFSSSLMHYDAQSGEFRGRLDVLLAPGSGASLAVGSRTVWFSGAGVASRVSRINPSTHQELEPVSIRGAVLDIVLGGGVLWVGSANGTLTSLDPLTGRRLSGIPIDGTPDALSYAADDVWVMDALASEVLRIDPTDGKVIARIPLAGNLKDIAAGDGGVWVLDDVAGTATQIDPATNRAHAPIRLGPAPSAIAVGLGSAWVTDGQDGNLYRIDPQLDRATPVRLGTPLAAVTVDDLDRELWVGTYATD